VGAVRRQKHRNPTPLIASIVLRTWVVVTQTATWIALSYDVPVYKLPAYWLPVVFAAFQTLVLFPLLLPGHGVGQARSAGAGGTR
jgi:hypothetical protein